MNTIIETTPFFSSFLGTGTLQIDHDKIVKWISKQNCDHGNKIDLSFQEPELEDFYEELTILFNGIHDGVGLSKKYKQVLQRGWVNTKDSERFNLPHRHPEATFISVYYPYVDGQVGELEMINPNPLMEYVIPSGKEHSHVDQLNIYNSNLWQIKPYTGLIVFFPSWIQHYALPTLNGNRISIAVNSVTTSCVDA